MIPEPVFSEEKHPRDKFGRLIVCAIGAHRGAARVFSGEGAEERARGAAEAQARAKWEAAGGPAE